MPDPLAAVDVGTNSLHLVVARTTDGDRFEVLTREKEMVRLGSGSTDMKTLAPAAIDRAVAALGRFRKIADSQGAPLRAVATSAVREAENSHDLLIRARLEAGVEIEVVSGVEEARLIHLGVLQALELYDRRLLLCDIGGGSTELLIGEQGEVLASVSFKLGAVRLTNRFFAAERLHPSSVDSCRRHIQEVLASFDRSVRDHPYEVAVGSSGTIEQVYRLARALAGDDPLRTLNGATLTSEQVRNVVAVLIEARAAGTTADLPDLDPKRADIILAGALVLEGVVLRFRIEELLLSEYALREGVLLDTIARQRGGSLPHLRDVARRSVLDLMLACDEDPQHSEHVARLALQLFDATIDHHHLDSDARSLLEAAALLANSGLLISHAKHHKHSYYLIRNSDRLVGFTDQEIEVVAQIARYHRKSAPKASHPEWGLLDDHEQRVVLVGAGVLRVAIGLDRSHQQAITDLVVTDRGPTLVVEAITRSPGFDIGLELYAADERKQLLEQVLDVEVVIEQREPVLAQPPADRSA
ncbi:Ppx/GppA phosphatase family protein [Aquihabitans sp. McL0605]|uniref:Ppx/GppA phosphatase family protein n=1 Tax=Aquihabitans sp. McL0605 TaxID=3415671 RepID=UPI003CED286B